MASRKEFECTDIFKKRVSCSRKRWKHVCIHAEMVNLQNLVKSIIIKPDFVNKTRFYANRFTFYRKCFLAQLSENEKYIRIVIEYNMNEVGELCGGVISAMACVTPQIGEVLIWKGRAT